MEQYGQLLSLAVIFGAFYMLMIRPQQKRQKEHRALLAALEVGDRVVTIGGAYGTVRTLGDDVVGVEVAPSVVIEFARSAIATREEEPAAPQGDE